MISYEKIKIKKLNKILLSEILFLKKSIFIYFEYKKLFIKYKLIDRRLFYENKQEM